MTHSTGIMLDVAHNNIIYGPYMSTYNFEGAVIFGRTYEGCEHTDKLVELDSLRDWHDKFKDPCKDTWPSSYLAYHALMKGNFKVRVFFSSKECLFEAMRDYAAQKVDKHQECIEFCCGLFPETARYTPSDELSQETVETMQARLNGYNESPMFEALQKIDARTLQLPNDRLRGEKGALIQEGYRNIGRGGRGKKRW